MFSSAEAAALLAAQQHILRALTRPAEVERMLATIAGQAAGLVRAPAATTCLLEPEGPDLLRVRVGVGALAGCEGELLPLEGSFAGEAVRTGAIQSTPDLHSDLHPYPLCRGELPIGPVLAVPLLVGDRPFGTLLVAREPGAPAFHDRDADLLQNLAEAAASALESVRVHDEARGSRAAVEAWRREVELTTWLRRYEVIVARDRGVVFEWDVKTGRIRWGETLPEVFGYTPEEFGQTMEIWLERLSPEERYLVRGSLELAARRGEPLRIELHLSREDGSARRVEMRADHADGGTADDIVGVLTDITERESEVDERRVRIRATKALVGALRHEINNPLATVMGQAQHLQTEDIVQSDPMLQESVRRIYMESRRIADLMQRLAEVEEASEEVRFNALGGIDFPPDEA